MSGEEEAGTGANKELKAGEKSISDPPLPPIPQIPPAAAVTAPVIRPETHPETGTPKCDAGRKKHDGYDKASLLFNFLTFFAAAIAAAAAVVLACFTHTMVKDAEDTAKIQHDDTIAALTKTDLANSNATDALHQSQRPWVVADNVRVNDHIDFTSSPFTVPIWFKTKNAGSSVAKEVRDWASIARVLIPDTEVAWSNACANLEKSFARFGEAGIGTGHVLAPNDPYEHPLHLVEIGVSGDQIVELIRSNTSGFNIVGCIEYKDQYAISHKTRFCFAPLLPKELTPLIDQPPVTSLSEITFRKCEGFQDAN